MKRQIMSVAVMFGLGLFLGNGLLANHPWSCYKWATTTVGFADAVEENSSGKAIKREAEYLSAFSGAVSVWDGTIIDLVPGNELELFYDTYGRRGWLGLASIFPSGCIITAGTAKVNATYMDDTSRYDQTSIDHVACQEVGHTFGLDHNRNDNNTCMNDTILTAGNQINQHDKDQLNLIY